MLYRVTASPAYLQVVYLIFNDGYSASSGDNLVWAVLYGEALRLGRLLVDLLPDDAEAWGLLSLMQLHARRDARVDTAGRYVILADHNPSRWDTDLLRVGRASLDHAVRLDGPGPCQMQARSPRCTYRARRMAAHTPSAIIEVNRAAAIGFADGPEAGLRALAPLLSEPALE